jgi:hypothetical protein
VALLGRLHVLLVRPATALLARVHVLLVCAAAGRSFVFTGFGLAAGIFCGSARQPSRAVRGFRLENRP